MEKEKSASAPEEVTETKISIQFVDVGVEYPVHKADARTLVRILIRELDMDFPETALERSCSSSAIAGGGLGI